MENKEYIYVKNYNGGMIFNSREEAERFTGNRFLTFELITFAELVELVKNGKAYYSKWEVFSEKLAKFRRESCEAHVQETKSPHSAQNSQAGVKHDDDKPTFTYLLSEFPEELAEVDKVLKFGMERYGKDNWKKFEDPVRFQEALQRHAIAVFKGEKIDKDSGLSHIAHLITNALFISKLEG